MYFSRACAIGFDDQVVVAGGLYTKTTVSVYNDDGWQEDLEPLNQGRWGHACGHYTSNDGLVMY